jgi:hypothetical protein
MQLNSYNPTSVSDFIFQLLDELVIAYGSPSSGYREVTLVLNTEEDTNRFNADVEKYPQIFTPITGLENTYMLPHAVKLIVNYGINS